MFTPVGFYAAAGGGFDPTLGGTLSVKYHWDFTDSSTMTLSGTDVTAITDKVNSYVLNSYLASDPQLNTGYVRLASSAGLRSGLNNIPPGMFSNNTFTMTAFTKLTGGMPAGINLLSLQSNQTNGWRGDTRLGYRTSMPGTWTPELCDNFGSGTNIHIRWYGPTVKNDSKYSSLTTTQALQQSVAGFGYNTTDAYLLYDNGSEETYCNRSFEPSTDTGNGFYISNGNPETLDYYHIVVHDELISSADMNALYDAWQASQV